MDLRHLRYFAAVVEHKGYREASRRLFVAQAALSQTILDLERELEVKLFSRARRGLALTSEGETFYQEATRTLEQAEKAVESVKRASRGEIGALSIGYFDCATYSFLPALIRRYRARHPGVKLKLKHLPPARQEEAMERGLLDAGFSRVVRSNAALTFRSLPLFEKPLLVAFAQTDALGAAPVRVADLRDKPFVLLGRDAYPPLFDTIVGLCTSEGFSPAIEHEVSEPQSIFTLVAAGEGVSIVPAWFKNLRCDGVEFATLAPDTERIELALVWPKASASRVLRSFVDTVEANLEEIREAAR